MGLLQEIQAKISGATAKQFDSDSQPLNAAYRSQAVANRQVDELIGIVKGVMADGMVHQGEAEFLLLWMRNNNGALDKWPAKAIYPRLASALADGHMDPAEESEIMDILLATVGGNTAPMHAESSDSSTLPFCKPFPFVSFEQRIFCFTGKFQSGTRQWCEDQIKARGGIPSGTINKKLHYLVIGDIGSRDWLHSTHGTKIEKAMEYRDSGVALHIVGEEHWFDSISKHSPKTAIAG